MNPLQLLNPDVVQNGQRVLARQGRSGPDGVIWGLWREQEILVTRRVKAIMLRGVMRPAGELLLLTLQDVNCADYGPDDYDPIHDTWMVEDYNLQIKGAF